MTWDSKQEPSNHPEHHSNHTATYESLNVMTYKKRKKEKEKSKKF